MLLRGKRPPSFRWLNILTLAAQVSGKFIVLNERIHRFHDLRLFIEVLDWKRHFDPPEKIPWHPIRTSQKGSLARGRVMEMKNPTVLQKPAQ